MPLETLETRLSHAALHSGLLPNQMAVLSLVMQAKRNEAEGRPAPSVPQSIHLGAPLQVQVNAGRWMVLCPDCRSAEYASRGDPRFFCVDCGNRAVGGQWRKVEWPANVEEIERVLSLRPDRENQSWKPGESLGQLKAENADHGVVV